MGFTIFVLGAILFCGALLVGDDAPSSWLPILALAGLVGGGAMLVGGYMINNTPDAIRADNARATIAAATAAVAVGTADAELRSLERAASVAATAAARGAGR